MFRGPPASDIPPEGQTGTYFWHAEGQAARRFTASNDVPERHCSTLACCFWPLKPRARPWQRLWCLGLQGRCHEVSCQVRRGVPATVATSGALRLESDSAGPQLFGLEPGILGRRGRYHGFRGGGAFIRAQKSLLSDPVGPCAAARGSTLTTHLTPNVKNLAARANLPPLRVAPVAWRLQARHRQMTHVPIYDRYRHKQPQAHMHQPPNAVEWCRTQNIHPPTPRMFNTRSPHRNAVKSSPRNVMMHAQSK